MRVSGVNKILFTFGILVYLFENVKFWDCIKIFIHLSPMTPRKENPILKWLAVGLLWLAYMNYRIVYLPMFTRPIVEFSTWSDLLAVSTIRVTVGADLFCLSWWLFGFWWSSLALGVILVINYLVFLIWNKIRKHEIYK